MHHPAIDKEQSADLFLNLRRINHVDGGDPVAAMLPKFEKTMSSAVNHHHDHNASFPVLAFDVSSIKF